MKFLLLFKSKLHNYSPREMQITLKEYMNWIKKLKQENSFINGDILMKMGIHIKDKDCFDDYIDKEENIITGYLKIQVIDIVKAIEVANSCPLLRYNEILIRPVI